MIRQTLFKFLILGFFLAMMSACATTPIVGQYRQMASLNNVSFSMALQNPDAYINDTVIWGGHIIKTINLPNGTEIIVLQAPLESGDRPGNVESSQGRFIAMSSKFLDPAIYEEGKKITLAGQITGNKTLPLGETSYTYPVVTIKQLHLWKKGSNRYYHYPYDYRYWGWGPYYGWGPWYPYPWYP